jgi:hypothetical protein
LKTFALLVAGLSLAACGDYITPKISTKLDAKRNDAGAIEFSVTVKNDTDRPTVPLVVMVKAFEPGAGDKGIPVIQPAAFVLNHQESRTITGKLETPSQVIAQLTIREAERGILLRTDSKTISATPQQP